MFDIARLFQAFVAPAIFVSAAALLLLSLNVRLMGIVNRLRDFQHRHHHATQAGHIEEARVFSVQMRSIDSRAELIRKSMLLVLVSLIGTTVSCLLLGLALYEAKVGIPAVLVFVLSILLLLAGGCFYAAEIRIALQSVREEANYYNAMDTEEASERHERRRDWQRPGN